MTIIRFLLKHREKAAYWFVFLNIAAGTLLLIYSPLTLKVLLKEDSYAETSGAIFLLVTGLILLFASWKLYRGTEQKDRSFRFMFSMLLIAGLAFCWAAGEEISWGQRIFMLDVPEKWAEINKQRELNLHNLNTRIFNNAVETIILLMIVVPTICMHLGKKRLFGFMLPGYWIILGLQLVSCYVPYNYVKTQDYLSHLVLIYFFIYHLKIRDWERFIYVILNIGLVTAVGFINYQLSDNFGTNGPREFREYLFSLLCLAYSYSIYKDLFQPSSRIEQDS